MAGATIMTYLAFYLIQTTTILGLQTETLSDTDNMSNFVRFIRPHGDREFFFIGVLLLIFFTGFVMALLQRRSTGLAFPKTHYWVQVVPGLLLTVGLLGTFIGIGMAIGGLEALLSADRGKDLSTAIQPIIGQLGLKFKCSVWGISLNFIFRAAQVIIGVDSKREEDEWDNIKSMVNETKALIGQTNEDLRRVEILIGYSTTGNKGISDLIVETNASLVSLVSHASRFASSVSTIGASAATMEKAAIRLDGSVMQFNENVKQFQGKVESVMGKAESTLKNMGENLRNSTVEMSTKLAETFNNFSSGVKDTLKLVGASMAVATTSIAKAQEKSSTEIQNSTSSLEKAVTNMTETTSSQYGKIQVLLEQVQDYLVEVKAQLKGSEKRVALQATTMGDLNTEIKRMMDTIGGAYYETYSNLSKIDRTTSSLHNCTIDILNQLKQESLARAEVVKRGSTVKDAEQAEHGIYHQTADDLKNIKEKTNQLLSTVGNILKHLKQESSPRESR